jgi:signal transduction histidine kinase
VNALCVIILQNITETKIIENKLKMSKEAAEAANEAKSAFIAKMSHEIRTPLNAIIGFADQLTKTKLNKKQSTYLEVVNNSSRHLLSTIDDILVISR